MRLHEVWLGALTAVALSLTARTVGAGEPGAKKQCALAKTEAEGLRRHDKLVAASRRFAECSASSCPTAVREECEIRLKDTKRAIPTIRFIATSQSGAPPPNVRIFIDGVPVVTPIAPVDGNTIDVDPGEHTFGLEADGYQTVHLNRVLREGDRLEETAMFVPIAKAAPSAERSPNPLTETTPKEESAVPPPNTGGFQMSGRIGVSFPASNAADIFTSQAVALVDAGGKWSDHVFLGGYAGLGIGSSSTAFCSSLETCTARGSNAFRIGVVLRYHFLPSQRFDPWIGAGLGFEVSHAGFDRRSTDPAVVVLSGGTAPLVPISIDLSGVESRLMAGLDVRLNKTIGVGPVIDLVTGRYTAIAVSSPGAQPFVFPDDKYGYIWFSFGARAVLFP